MTGLEITLVVTGVIFLIGSFLVKDKLSPKDIDKIAALSEEELKILVEKQIDNARNKTVDEMEEYKKNMSIVQRKRYKNKEARKKQSKAQKKRYEDEKEREKTSLANKKRFQDPKEREKSSQPGEKNGMYGKGYKITGLIEKDYTIGEVVGSGAFASVRKVKSKTNGQIRALKIIKKQKNQNSARMYLEVEILKKLIHPNIMQIFEFYEDKGR